MSSSTRSLVIGAFAGLPAHLSDPFVTSLRASGYRGSLCIVTGHADASALDQLAARADDVVDVGPDYPDELALPRKVLAYLRGTRRIRRLYAQAFRRFVQNSFERWRILEYQLEGLQALRYAHYRQYVSDQAGDADAVMLTDVRDVVFQRDPFAEPPQGLELYLEDPSVKFGSDHFNTRWVREVYGRDALARVWGRPVSCSGTVVGTRAAVLDYLDAMSEEIMAQRRPMGSRDQAVHNMLIARGRFPNARLVANGEGRVVTMGLMKTYRHAASGEVENVDGTVPAILHQWDRHAELAARFFGAGL